MSKDNIVDINTNVTVEPDVLEPTHEEVLGFVRTLQYLRSLSFTEEGKIDFDFQSITIELSRYESQDQPTNNIMKFQKLTESVEVEFDTSETNTIVYDIKEGLEELRKCEEE